jgi:hypothetical protein
MLVIYQTLARLALHEFKDIVTKTTLVGGTPANPNKLRLTLIDSSFLDIWLSTNGDYSYHWEQRPQSGKLYRWGNAPHYPRANTFPVPFHNGDENTVVESNLSSTPEPALRQVLDFARQQLT